LPLRRKVLTNIKTILAFAQGQGLVAQNVAPGCEDQERWRAHLRAGRDFPAMAELRTIMAEATGRWRPFVITAIFTGMGASELRGLKWSDVDLNAAIIHVRRRAEAWGKCQSGGAGSPNGARTCEKRPWLTRPGRRVRPAWQGPRLSLQRH